MGLNVDLTQMLGIPNKVRCPKCAHVFNGMFDDYDIECGNPNPAPGKWALSVYCPECENDFKVSFKLLREECK